MSTQGISIEKKKTMQLSTQPKTNHQMNNKKRNKNKNIDLNMPETRQQSGRFLAKNLSQALALLTQGNENQERGGLALLELPRC